MNVFRFGPSTRIAPGTDFQYKNSNKILKRKIERLIDNYYRKNKFVQSITVLRKTFGKMEMNDCYFNEDTIDSDDYNELINQTETNDIRITRIISQNIDKTEFEKFCDEITTSDATLYYDIQDIPCIIRYFQKYPIADSILEEIIDLRDDDVEFFKEKINNAEIKSWKQIPNEDDRSELFNYMKENIKKCNLHYLEGGKKTKKSKKSKKSRKTKRRTHKK